MVLALLHSIVSPRIPGLSVSHWKASGQRALARRVIQIRRLCLGRVRDPDRSRPFRLRNLGRAGRLVNNVIYSRICFPRRAGARYAWNDGGMHKNGFRVVFQCERPEWMAVSASGKFSICLSAEIASAIPGRRFTHGFRSERWPVTGDSAREISCLGACQPVRHLARF